MVRIDHDVGIYEEHYARIIQWYNLAFKGKHPSKEDKKTFNLFNVIYEDVVRENKEEKEANEHDHE
jgi:hypothetical protein